MISRAIVRGAVRAELGGGLALIVLLAAATAARADTFRVKTDRGTFLVEVDAPGVTVRGEGDELVVSRTGGDEVRLKLDSDRADRPTKDPVLAIRRDGKVIVSARRISSGPALPLTTGPGRMVLGS